MNVTQNLYQLNDSFLCSELVGKNNNLTERQILQLAAIQRQGGINITEKRRGVLPPSPKQHLRQVSTVFLWNEEAYLGLIPIMPADCGVCVCLCVSVCLYVVCESQKHSGH